jgi:integrase
VGLKKAGPHLLRHTALTRLANLGASVYVIQAVARHAHLQTTQVYLHTQQTGLSREAANLLDRAAAAGGFAASTAGLGAR